MGYTTTFTGAFKFSKPLTKAQHEYLTKFSETRRMKRNAKFLVSFPDPFRDAAGLPIGIEGGYFVNGGGFAGQDRDATIFEYNTPPMGQPGLWCKWAPDKTGENLIWNGHEKFYHYIEWLHYLIEHFFTPWGITLSGSVEWQGEDDSDKGTITISENGTVFILVNGN